MTEDKKVCEGSGTIESKAEAVTKKGEKYWKFTVDGKIYSLFEYEAGHDVGAGDNVKMFWTETVSNYDNKTVTYRNLNSIFKSEETPVEKIEDNPNLKMGNIVPPTQEQNQKVNDFKAAEADKFELGMAKNNATLIFCEILEKNDSVDQTEDFIKTHGEMWDKLVVSLYNRGKKIREQLLGY